MQPKLIKPEHRRKHGKMVGKTLYLNEGVCYTQYPLNNQEKKPSCFINTNTDNLNTETQLWT